MSLAILVPMLGRAHRIEPLLASIRAATPTAKVLFLTAPTDADVRAAIDRTGEERLDVEYAPGDYQRKINAGYRHTTEELLFMAADDVHFHPGWFEACKRRLCDQIGAVGTNDLSNRRAIRGRHSTHSLVARWYADLGTIDGQPGILCEEYPHEFCDDEFVATARKRRAWAHATDAIVEHLHPMASKAPMDDLYAQQGERMAAGRVIYQRRKRLWT